MDEGSVALIVGLAAALATVVGAVVNSHYRRRDDRDTLMQDVELAKQLREGTHAKKILEFLIEERISDMAVRYAIRTAHLAFLVPFTMCQASLIAVLVLKIAAMSTEEFQRSAFFVAVAAGVGAWATGRFVFDRARSKRIAEIGALLVVDAKTDPKRSG